MESNLQYAEKVYWDERFLSEDSFEWLADFESFKHLILPHLNKKSRILHIGCGSSQMSMKLYELGYTNITNLDYSQVLVDTKREKHKEMEWVCDDIRSMQTIESGSIDVVLEKATLEALLVGEKVLISGDCVRKVLQSPWSPSDSALETLDSIFEAVHRVLAPAGVFVSVSFTQPHFRVPALLRNPNWRVELDEFGSLFHYFVYVCHRDETTSSAVRDRFLIAPSWGRALDHAPFQ